MTKSELVKKLSRKYPNLYQKDITMIIETVLEEVSNAMVRGDRVELRGFGAFSLRKREARKARNPRTNEVVNLEERHSLYFRAGKGLRERLNRKA